MVGLGIQELALLALLLVSVFLTTVTGGHRLSWGALLIVGVLAWVKLTKWGRLRGLPDVTDDAFVENYAKQFSTLREQVILGRRDLARILGIPATKLSPDDRLQDVARRAGFFGSDSVALNDLDEELLTVFKEAGLEKPAARATTVAEAIHQLSTARSVSSDRVRV